MAWSIYLASQTPELKIKDVHVKDSTENLKIISATISNEGFLPTHSAPDLQYGICRPDHIILETNGKIISAQQIDDRNNPSTGRSLGSNSSVFSVPNIEGNSAIQIQWVVNGTGKFKIIVDSVKGGIAVFNNHE
jgi:hypothetical protein